MPIEPPEVHVTDDPLVVLLFAGLFGAVVLLALAFALIGSRHPVEEATDPFDPDSEPETAPPKSPWSTSPPDGSPPWQAPDRDP